MLIGTLITNMNIIKELEDLKWLWWTEYELYFPENGLSRKLHHFLCTKFALICFYLFVSTNFCTMFPLICFENFSQAFDNKLVVVNFTIFRDWVYKKQIANHVKHIILERKKKKIHIKHSSSSTRTGYKKKSKHALFSLQIDVCPYYLVFGELCMQWIIRLLNKKIFILFMRTEPREWLNSKRSKWSNLFIIEKIVYSIKREKF